MAEIPNVKLKVDELIADTEVTSPLFTGNLVGDSTGTHTGALVATTISASGAVTLSSTLAVQTDGLIVDATKRVLIGTAVTTGSAAGDVVLANQKMIRGVHGATTLGMLYMSSAGRTSLEFNNGALNISNADLRGSMGALSTRLYVIVNGTEYVVPLYALV